MTAQDPTVLYTVVDPEGNILKSGSCNESQVTQQAAPGQTLIIGEAHNDLEKRWNGSEFVDIPVDSEAELAKAWQKFRTQRNRLLASCDWTQLADVDLSPEVATAWTDYRQALRDLPDNINDPYNPIWPTQPE